MKLTYATLLLGAGLALAACKGEPKAAEPAQKAETPAKTAETPKPNIPEGKQVAAAEPEIVVPADFEEEVATEITADNYKNALDSLEAEISE